MLEGVEAAVLPEENKVARMSGLRRMHRLALSSIRSWRPVPVPTLIHFYKPSDHWNRESTSDLPVIGTTTTMRSGMLPAINLWAHYFKCLSSSNQFSYASTWKEIVITRMILLTPLKLGRGTGE